MSKLLKIEKYLIKNNSTVADDTYISDGYVLIRKDFLNNKILKNYKTHNGNIIETIPFEKGADWELPEQAHIVPFEQLAFKINEQFGIKYKYIKMFKEVGTELFTPATFTILKTYNEEIKQNAPFLKVWLDKNFIGAIACFQLVKGWEKTEEVEV